MVRSWPGQACSDGVGQVAGQEGLRYLGEAPPVLVGGEGPDDVEAVGWPIIGWGWIHRAQVVADPVEGFVVPRDEVGAGAGADLFGEVDLVTGGVAPDDLQAQPGGQRTEGLDRAFAVAAGVRGGVDGVRPSQLGGWVAAGRGEQLDKRARAEPAGDGETVRVLLAVGVDAVRAAGGLEGAFRMADHHDHPGVGGLAFAARSTKSDWSWRCPRRLGRVSYGPDSIHPR